MAKIEVDLSHAEWRGSPGSDSDGACVEVAIVPGGTEASGGAVALRDSKNPTGPALLFTPDEWREFTRAVRHGEAGRP